MVCQAEKKLEKRVEDLESIVATYELKIELLQVQMTNLYRFTASQVNLEDIKP